MARRVGSDRAKKVASKLAITDMLYNCHVIVKEQRLGALEARKSGGSVSYTWIYTNL